MEFENIFPEKTIKILEDYDNNLSLYHQYGEAVKKILIRLFDSDEAILKAHMITLRIKKRNSLEKKLVRENHKYDSINEITDIVGLRVVTYFANDIDGIANLFMPEFNIDIPNSVDKRRLPVDFFGNKNSKLDSFGYQSLHFIASLNSRNLKLLENQSFENLKFELQIRSNLQHSWASIEHPLEYKGDKHIPDSAKKTFFRIAALLEQADIEFDRLRMEIEEYQNSVEHEFFHGNGPIPLTATSLKIFITKPSVLTDIENKVSNELDWPVVDPLEVDYSKLEDTVSGFAEFGVTDLRELEELVKKYSDEIYKWLYYPARMFKVAHERNDSFYQFHGFAAGSGLTWILLKLQNPMKDIDQMLGLE